MFRIFQGKRKNNEGGKRRKESNFLRKENKEKGGERKESNFSWK